MVNALAQPPPPMRQGLPMKRLFVFLTSLAVLSSACAGGPDLAAAEQDSVLHQNLPANQCQIFVNKIKVAPSSHGSGALHLIVKVPFLGGGEFIHQVGYWGHPQATDLGNDPSCTG